MTSAGSKSAALIPGHERPAEFVVRDGNGPNGWRSRWSPTRSAGFQFRVRHHDCPLAADKTIRSYTLANTLLGTLSVISDGGISSGVMAQGARSGRTTPSSGLSSRRKEPAPPVRHWNPLVVGTFLHMAVSRARSSLERHRNYSAGCHRLFWAAFLSTIYAVAPNLWQRLRDTQRIAVEQNLIRLGCLGGSLLAFPTAVTAVGATLVGQGWSVFRLKRISSRLVDLGQSENAEIRREVLKITKRVLPSAIYFCISSQLMIWLISVFGTNAGLAQIGALGRLGQVFTVFSGIATAAIAPRFARLPAQRNLIARRYSK